MSGPVVAVTGASGFTGSALVEKLAREGYAVRAMVRDSARYKAPPGVEVVVGELGDPAAYERLVAGADTVFHIAAMFRDEGSREEFYAINYEATRSLLAAARAAKVRRFVYCSTIGVHGDVSQIPADEQAPFNPRDLYQESKLAAEEFCRREAAEGSIEIVIIRPCSIYGPGDVRMLKMFRMLDRGAFFFVGSYRPNFHPVYIDDLVQGFMLAMTSPEAPGQTFIIGGPRYLPLREYVAIAAKTIDARTPKLTIPYKPMYAAAIMCERLAAMLGVRPPLHRRRLSFFKHNRSFTTAKARRMLGYSPTVDIEEGFARTVAWYRQEGMLP